MRVWSNSSRRSSVRAPPPPGDTTPGGRPAAGPRRTMLPEGHGQPARRVPGIGSTQVVCNVCAGLHPAPVLPDPPPGPGWGLTEGPPRRLEHTHLGGGGTRAEAWARSDDCFPVRSRGKRSVGGQNARPSFHQKRSGLRILVL